MKSESTALLERQWSSEQLERQWTAWIDVIESTLRAQTEVYVGGLRLWQAGV